MTRGRTCLAVAALALAVVAGVTRVPADPLPEPPVDADPQADFTTEPDDSVETGSLSVGYGLSGRAGRTPGRSRSLRYRGDSVEAGLRDDDADSFGGGDVRSRGGGRVLRIGRIAPGWGRGLVVGAPADPWIARDGGGDPFAPRPRGGDGVSVAWPGAGVEVFAGRISGRSAAGLAYTVHDVRVGVASAHARPACATVSLDRGDRALEAAVDPAGRWRAEAMAQRSAGGLDVGLRASAGHEAFRAPLAPARASPSRTAAVALAHTAGPVTSRATLAGWSYTRGAAGLRAGLESAWRAGDGGTLAAGFEEQHGTRRAPPASGLRATGMRQGAWLEWRGVTPLASLTVRDEWWGRRAFARGRVRETLSASVEAPLPGDMALVVAHTVYRAHSGETVYLPERDTDRWVLRALSGAGDRTRAGLRVPLAEGTLAGSVTVGRARTAVRPQWSLQWSRRLRLRRGAP